MRVRDDGRLLLCVLYHVVQPLARQHVAPWRRQVLTQVVVVVRVVWR